VSWQRLAWPRKERIELYHSLATLLASGVQLAAALDAVGRQEARFRGAAGGLRARALADAARAVRGGAPAAAFAAIAPSAERLTLSRIAQLPGEGVFLAAARVAETGAAIRQAALRALGEPVLYLLAVGVMLWGAGGWFLPPFAAVAPVEEWPPLSRHVAALSLFVHGRVPEIGLTACTLAGLVGASMRWWTGPGRATLDRLPPWSVQAIVEGAAFVLAVRCLSGTGLAVGPDALRSLRESASPWLAWKIRGIERRMAAGADFGEALAAADGFPSPRIATVAGALAGAGNFHAAFAGAADRWLARVPADVQAAATLLQYVFLTLAAVALLAMVQVMFSLMGLAA